MIELVTVSDGFADFLAETLPRNSIHFDRIVVVSGEHDGGTERVVRDNHGRCGCGLVQTDAFKIEAGDIWNKGRAINDGLAQLSRRGLIVHLDADIVLPANFREVVESFGRLHPNTVYGAHRLFCDSFNQWESIKGSWDVAGLRPDRVHAHGDDPLPVGYFQLFSGGSKVLAGGGPWYPTDNPQAGGSDVAFAKSFDRRRYLDGLAVIHLQTEPQREGINWKGRKAAPWPRYASLLEL